MSDTEGSEPDQGTALRDILSYAHPRGDTPTERGRWRKIVALAAERLKHENDVVATDHGSIVTLEPRTDAARDWFAAHLVDAMRVGGDMVAVESRYVGPILDGLDADGLTVEGVSRAE